MGIHGLTSYVAKRADRLFGDYKLHDCVVLIDGNSAASLVYSERTKSNHAFGGDYDRFANSTVELIRLFEKCNVKPIFVFDGGYELRKLRTVLDRIKSNIMICGQYKNKYRESKTFPLMLRDVFRSILIDLHVTVLQCDFEADHELVVLARILRCPIISNDSDFYICDSPYVPFNFVDFRAVRFKKNTAKRRYYIPCKIFLIDIFLDYFGGLKNKALLPLLSCALGNDYIPKNSFRNFLNLNQFTDFDTKIKRILEWLQSFTAVDDAIEQMMKHVWKDVNSIKRNIKQMVNEYNSETSNLLSSLPNEIFPGPKHEINGKDSGLISIDESEDSGHVDEDLVNGNVLADFDINNYIPDSESSDEDDIEIELVEEYEITVSDTDYDSEEKDAQIVESDLGIIRKSNTESDSRIFDKNQNNNDIVTSNVLLPTWFSQKYRSGLIPPNLMNVINFQRLFIPSQSEDYFSNPSHEISLPLLQKIVAIILGPSFNGIVKCHARIKGMEIGVYEIIPVFEVPDLVLLPNLEIVETLDQSSRIILLLACANLPQNIDLTTFPEEWRLYVIALMYWTKNCASTINSTHIRAIVICLIQLSIIDRKIGFARSVTDLKEILKEAKRISNTNVANVTELTANAYVDETESLFSNEKNYITVEDYLAVISKEDCYRVTNSLLPFHETHENLLKNRKRFNTKLVHSFAQLQHCIQSITMLNVVLNFPFVPCRLHRFFSGTFLYNFYVELHNRKLADGFVTRNLLTKSPGIIALYRYIIKSWEALTSIKVVRPKFEMKKKSKKSKKVTKVEEVKEEDVVIDEYQDPNNFFSLLPIE